MIEFLQFCFEPVNLPYSVLLLICGGYWALLVVGVFGLDALDLELEADPGDIDIGTGVGGFILSILKFFNLGEVPLMILVTVLAASMWTISLCVNYYFNPEASTWVAFLWFVPNLIASLFVAKFVTWPLGTFFKYAERDSSAQSKIVGQTCVVTTSEVTETFGQGEVAQEGPAITLNIRVNKGDRLVRGDRALIVENIPEKDTYLVVPFDLETNEDV